MTEIKWVRPIVTATAIAESEWKRQLETASTAFKPWNFFYPRGTELDRSLYSARQGIRSLPAKHAWKNRRNCLMVVLPYDEYQRVMEAKTVKMNDQKPVIKMVTRVAQAAEMAMSETKRQRAALKPKK